MRIAVSSPVNESLEPRRMMSASLGADGRLTITATDAADSVYVKAVPTRHSIVVVINGAITSYPEASIKCVNAMLGMGNDRFDATAASIPVWADGESGNDTLLGGGGNDCLIAGLDNDSVEGNLGDDSLCGNGGKDIINGGPGRDRLDGGKSFDILHGGSSNDRLFGGDGADQLYGDGDDDRFYCNGIYTDSLFGGTGSDTACVDHDDILASIEIAIVD